MHLHLMIGLIEDLSIDLSEHHEDDVFGERDVEALGMAARLMADEGMVIVAEDPRMRPETKRGIIQCHPPWRQPVRNGEDPGISAKAFNRISPFTIHRRRRQCQSAFRQAHAGPGACPSRARQSGRGTDGRVSTTRPVHPEYWQGWRSGPAGETFRIAAREAFRIESESCATIFPPKPSDNGNTPVVVTGPRARDGWRLSTANYEVFGEGCGGAGQLAFQSLQL